MGPSRQVRVVITSLLLASFVGIAAPAFAIPFGGPIINSRPGNGCVVIDVGPPRGGEFVFQKGVSILFAFFNIIRPGAFVLGLAGLPLVCFLGKIPIGAGPAIIIVGTSL